MSKIGFLRYFGPKFWGVLFFTSPIRKHKIAIISSLLSQKMRRYFDLSISVKNFDVIFYKRKNEKTQK